VEPVKFLFKAGLIKRVIAVGHFQSNICPILWPQRVERSRKHDALLDGHVLPLVIDEVANDVVHVLAQEILIAQDALEDPVRLGLAESFAHPGGNVTGFLLTADQEILGKRLQLLRDAAPGISRVGIMANPDSAGDAAELRMAPSIAGRIGLHYRLFEARTDTELEAALAAAAK
jgi:ABC-type uncharacterized transport system substrate-binding protein